MTRSPPWTDSENTALIALYFAMLDKALTGQPYNKAAMIRATAVEITPTFGTMDGPLIGRSKQSIEFKLMNASAAHASLDPHADTMDTFGYRAMPNYQAALKQAMGAEVERRCDEYNNDADLIDLDREQTA
jgi:hypothetical protein